MEELEDPLQGRNHGPGSRNGPAQQHRRVKKAPAREAAVSVRFKTEEAFASEANDEVEVKDIVEKVNVNQSKHSGNKIDNLEDELCSEEEYNKHVEKDSDIFKITIKLFPD